MYLNAKAMWIFAAFLFVCCVLFMIVFSIRNAIGNALNNATVSAKSTEVVWDIDSMFMIGNEHTEPVHDCSIHFNTGTRGDSIEFMNNGNVTTSFGKLSVVDSVDDDGDSLQAVELRGTNNSSCLLTVYEATQFLILVCTDSTINLMIAYGSEYDRTKLHRHNESGTVDTSYGPYVPHGPAPESNPMPEPSSQPYAGPVPIPAPVPYVIPEPQPNRCDYGELERLRSQSEDANTTYSEYHMKMLTDHDQSDIMSDGDMTTQALQNKQDAEERLQTYMSSYDCH